MRFVTKRNLMQKKVLDYNDYTRLTQRKLGRFLYRNLGKVPFTVKNIVLSYFNFKTLYFPSA